MPSRLYIPDLDQHLHQLDELGYTIIPDYLDHETTAVIRAHVDALLDADLPEVDHVPDALGQTCVIRVHERGIRQLRHPIPGETMPRIANNRKTIELGRALLGSHVRDLRLREQILSRNDFVPPPYGPSAWHIDSSFTREEYESTPRRIYYQMLHYCSTVEPGGAAFFLVPGSHKLAYAANVEPRSEAERQQLHADPTGVAGIDPDKGIEICGREGDLIIFNPMCLHSGSKNQRAELRYVYFTSFYDASAEWLVESFRKTGYRDGFPDSLRQGLPADLRHLLS